MWAGQLWLRLMACNSSTRKHGWSNLHSKCLIWMEITMLLNQEKWLQSKKKWSWKMVADLFISCYIPIAYVYGYIHIYIPKQLELLSWILRITGIFQATWLPLTWYLDDKFWWQLLWRPQSSTTDVFLEEHGPWGVCFRRSNHSRSGHIGNTLLLGDRQILLSIHWGEMTCFGVCHIPRKLDSIPHGNCCTHHSNSLSLCIFYHILKTHIKQHAKIPSGKLT